ncbi:TetR/AcrR family transcriptional regulator [Kordiimonas marina]|uniref:TetR/AcrR family transcriptional regulator n=1 Tax=Kordiimonas marina TaxID=2872312 RepID=UPI001FF5F87E|nr:TetR/AcrR family transcriptional regulator [Kordiimonas marina]MCJ9430138.1 TetR/AcrR family transcriptional regulator [Kordiimonas marina]
MNQYSCLTLPKAPRTARGRKTQAKLLDAAEVEFGERGFHDASIAGITARADVALGTFYVYFEGKEAIFRALVAHFSRLTRSVIAERIVGAPDRVTAERLGLEAFIEHARAHPHIYRIIGEAQFVAPDAYQAYYQTFADAYETGLKAASARGDIREGHAEELAWALIGMNVFLGQRYGLWNPDKPAADVAAAISEFVAYGLKGQRDRSQA